MDTCCAIPDPDSKTMADRSEGLKMVGGSDGVHLTIEGYRNMAKNISDTIVKLENGAMGKKVTGSVSAGVHVSGSSSRVFWRGFSSPVGSKTASMATGWPKARRDWSHRSAGPYSHKGHRGGKY